MNNKKGFTLIELMIVLAVIAILAVVLVPKAGFMKDEARSAGVYTNQRAIVGYLETKTGKDFESNDGNLETALKGVFTGDDNLENPCGGDAFDVVTTVGSTKGCVYIQIDGTNKKYTVTGIDAKGNAIDAIDVH